MARNLNIVRRFFAMLSYCRAYAIETLYLIISTSPNVWPYPVSSLVLRVEMRSGPSSTGILVGWPTPTLQL